MENSTQATTDESLQKQQQPSETPKEKSAEYNWREMREAQRKLADENAALRRHLMDMEASQKAAAKAREPVLADDDLADVRTVRSLAEKRAAEIVEQQMAKMAAVNRVQYAELALKNQFPDIEKVLLDRDLQDRVQRNDPEFWEAANLIQDPYKKGAALYKLMRQHLVDPQVEANKATIDENAAKPRTGPGTQRSSPLTSGEIVGGRISASQARRNLETALRSSGWGQR